MPRYFFDITDQSTLTRDEEGTECADDRAMRRQTLESLAEMTRGIFPRDGDRHDLHVDARNSDGRIIYTACVALTARWLD